MCYKDMTFCTFGLLCKDGYKCDRVLNDKIIAEAKEWMEEPPIAVYADFPECFQPFFMEVKREP
jgi:hypothetical protein